MVSNTSRRVLACWGYCLAVHERQQAHHQYLRQGLDDTAGVVEETLRLVIGRGQPEHRVSAGCFKFVRGVCQDCKWQAQAWENRSSELTYACAHSIVHEGAVHDCLVDGHQLHATAENIIVQAATHLARRRCPCHRSCSALHALQASTRVTHIVHCAL